MRCKFRFRRTDGENIRLVCAKSNISQVFRGFIYGLISAGDRELAWRLHDSGYTSESSGSRDFKLFVYSIHDGGCGDMPINGSRKHYETSEVVLMVSTPIEEISKALVKGAFSRRGVLELGEDGKSQPVRCVLISTVSSPLVLPDDRRITGRTVTPIEVRTTTYAVSPQNNSESIKRTFFLDPAKESEEYNRIITQNLKRKFACYGSKEELKSIEDKEVRFIPLTNPSEAPGGRKDRRFMGKFELRGPSPLLECALACGLGSHNSSGYGMIERLAHSGRRINGNS